MNLMGLAAPLRIEIINGNAKRRNSPAPLFTLDAGKSQRDYPFRAGARNRPSFPAV